MGYQINEIFQELNVIIKLKTYRECYDFKNRKGVIMF